MDCLRLLPRLSTRRNHQPGGFTTKVVFHITRSGNSFVAIKNQKLVMMKKTILTLLTIAVLSIPSYAVTMMGKTFEFPNGAKEWSAPVETELGSDWMTKKGQPFVKISVRVRVIRKIFKGCRYEVEIKNVDQNGIRFEIDNGNGKAGAKMRPGDVEVFTMDSLNYEKIEGLEGCTTCVMDLRFHEVEGYKK